jgi:hypothetical protein
MLESEISFDDIQNSSGLIPVRVTSRLDWKMANIKIKKGEQTTIAQVQSPRASIDINDPTRLVAESYRTLEITAVCRLARNHEPRSRSAPPWFWNQQRVPAAVHRSPAVADSSNFPRRNPRRESTTKRLP